MPPPGRNCYRQPRCHHPSPIASSLPRAQHPIFPVPARGRSPRSASGWCQLLRGCSLPTPGNGESQRKARRGSGRAAALRGESSPSHSRVSRSTRGAAGLPSMRLKYPKPSPARTHGFATVAVVGVVAHRPGCEGNRARRLCRDYTLEPALQLREASAREAEFKALDDLHHLQVSNAKMTQTGNGPKIKEIFLQKISVIHSVSRYFPNFRARWSWLHFCHHVSRRLAW